MNEAIERFAEAVASIIGCDSNSEVVREILDMTAQSVLESDMDSDVRREWIEYACLTVDE